MACMACFSYVFPIFFTGFDLFLKWCEIFHPQILNDDQVEGEFVELEGIQSAVLEMKQELLPGDFMDSQWILNGYGSIPINTIFSGLFTSIYQLFFTIFHRDLNVSWIDQTWEKKKILNMG